VDKTLDAIRAVDVRKESFETVEMLTEDDDNHLVHQDYREFNSLQSRNTFQNRIPAGDIVSTTPGLKLTGAAS
jgi:hypothetical protein